MKIISGLAATAILAGAAIGFAGPAQAADFSGTYRYTAPNGVSTWTVTPCGSDCTHIADSSGWSADAHPFAGLWRFVVDNPNATVCNNDGTVPGTLTYKVDPPRQEGTYVRTNTSPAPCWLAPGYSQPIFFTLVRL
jgi:hypothetical protein